MTTKSCAELGCTNWNSTKEMPDSRPKTPCCAFLCVLQMCLKPIILPPRNKIYVFQFHPSSTIFPNFPQDKECQNNWHSNKIRKPGQKSEPPTDGRTGKIQLCSNAHDVEN